MTNVPQATSNAPIYAAIVTGTAALLGVLIGGLLQYFFSKRELKRKRLQAIYAVTLFIIEIIGVLNEFADEGAMYDMYALSTKLPKFLQDQLNILNSTMAEFEPQIAVDLLWVKQASLNVDAYLDQAWKMGKKDRFDKNIGPVLGMARVDVRTAIKYSKQVLIRGYNTSSWKGRLELRKKETVEQCISEKCLEKNWLARHMIIWGVRKI
jgi:hypothetical protein